MNIESFEELTSFILFVMTKVGRAFMY